MRVGVESLTMTSFGDDQSRAEYELHRTLVQFLTDNGDMELAAVMIDGAVSTLMDDYGHKYGLNVDIPTHAFALVTQDANLSDSLSRAMKTVATGHVDSDDPQVRFRVKLQSPSLGWQQVARELIVNSKGSNQAAVSRKLFKRHQRDLITYNELGYASQSEVRIAQELEGRSILFFPLAVAVRADTGELYRDHREVDFVICNEGAWGILEVSYHPNRYEKDKEKDAWFKKSGILCIEHYTAERCHSDPARVVDEFLAILAKHRR